MEGNPDRRLAGSVSAHWSQKCACQEPCVRALILSLWYAYLYGIELLSDESAFEGVKCSESIGTKSCRRSRRKLPRKASIERTNVELMLNYYDLNMLDHCVLDCWCRMRIGTTIHDRVLRTPYVCASILRKSRALWCTIPAHRLQWSFQFVLQARWA